MIINCLGHDTVPPMEHTRFHAQQIAHCTDPSALRLETQPNARGL